VESGLAVTGAQRIAKRLLDVVASATLLLLIAPLLGLVWTALKLSARGPAILVQERVGIDRRPIPCLKLRTGGPARVGRWLRSTGIDDLPQLWNVLRGDLSLVGPRPALVHEVVGYDVAAVQRLQLKSGLIGLRQRNLAVFPVDLDA
jgi:lipopolysaccharide/colanic/teichoic acid biosynthesis glycosyltransferase